MNFKPEGLTKTRGKYFCETCRISVDYTRLCIEAHNKSQKHLRNIKNNNKYERSKQRFENNYSNFSNKGILNNSFHGEINSNNINLKLKEAYSKYAEQQQINTSNATNNNSIEEKSINNNDTTNSNNANNVNINNIKSININNNINRDENNFQRLKENLLGKKRLIENANNSNTTTNNRNNNFISKKGNVKFNEDNHYNNNNELNFLERLKKNSKKEGTSKLFKEMKNDLEREFGGNDSENGTDNEACCEKDENDDENSHWSLKRKNSSSDIHDCQTNSNDDYDNNNKIEESEDELTPSEREFNRLKKLELSKQRNIHSKYSECFKNKQQIQSLDINFKNQDNQDLNKLETSKQNNNGAYISKVIKLDDRGSSGEDDYSEIEEEEDAVGDYSAKEDNVEYQTFSEKKEEDKEKPISKASIYNFNDNNIIYNENQTQTQNKMLIEEKNNFENAHNQQKELLENDVNTIINNETNPEPQNENLTLDELLEVNKFLKSNPYLESFVNSTSLLQEKLQQNKYDQLNKYNAFTKESFSNDMTIENSKENTNNIYNTNTNNDMKLFKIRKFKHGLNDNILDNTNNEISKSTDKNNLQTSSDYAYLGKETTNNNFFCTEKHSPKNNNITNNNSNNNNIHNNNNNNNSNDNNNINIISKSGKSYGNKQKTKLVQIDL